MKRKKYFHFLIYRLLFGILTGVLIFGTIFAYLKDKYKTAINQGFERLTDQYERMIYLHNQHQVDNLYINIMCNFYQADYIRMARVRDDGAFVPIYESDYDIVPTELSVQRWLYLTKEENLLLLEQQETTTDMAAYSVVFKKCDDIWDVRYHPDSGLINAYQLVWMSDVFSDKLFSVPAQFSEKRQKQELNIESAFTDDDQLYLGEVSTKADGFFGLVNGKEWDFREGDYLDYYDKVIDTLDNGPELPSHIYGFQKRPDEFLAQEGDIFLISSIKDLYAPGYNPKFQEFKNNRIYIAEMESNGRLTRGVIELFQISGHKYIIEYIITTATFTEAFRPALIVIAGSIAALCIIIPMLTAIRPYLQYKKAYELNAFKNNLIDSLAHNLKTPLQILSGYAENLKDTDDDKDKDRYADEILAKTRSMNEDIEAILKTAEKNDLRFKKASCSEVIKEVAFRVGADVDIEGDKKIRIDREYFKTALTCIIDNANKYRKPDSKINVVIDSKAITFANKATADRFTPGTGITIAGRILEQHKLKLTTEINKGYFIARISKKAARQKQPFSRKDSHRHAKT
ncbi:MAG: HAMP domain-containing histidine kinase [Clostridiales bacterium]|nr:HAMP domain-containing histidine kinase [Clostridiales bacterium]